MITASVTKLNHLHLRWFAGRLIGLLLFASGFLAYAQDCGGSCLSQHAPNANRSNSGSSPIVLLATLPATLTLSISSVNLSIPVSDPAKASAIVAVPITSSWTLNSWTANLELIAYFDSPLRALADEANHVIPSNRVLGALDNEQLAPFVETSTEGIAGASRTLFLQSISAHNRAASRTDTLRIQLSSIADLGAPQGNYRGTVRLRLVAY
jgi:hypothetical protein